MNAIRRNRGTATAVVLVALAALALGVVASTGNDPLSGESAVLGQEDATESTTPEAQETPTGEVEEFAPNLTTYEVFLARDPFEPVIPEADDGAPGGNGGTNGGGPVLPTASPTATPTTSPTPTPTGTDTLPPTNGDCVQNATVTCDGHQVSLVDVFETDNGADRAVVQVDQTLYEVGPGDTFATNFRAVSIDPPCATMQFGDDTFTLCEGESILK